MARSWGSGPIDIGRGGRPIELPPFLRQDVRVWRFIALGVVVVIFLSTSVYQVAVDEVGVVQRFGRYVATTEPGLHFKIPFGVDTVTTVPVQQTQKMEFGFRTVRAGIKSEFAPQSPKTAAESLMLTGDLNMAVVEWIVQYQIRDPRRYLFHVRDVDGTFRHMAEASMRQVVGDHSVDEVITIGREAIAFEAKQELQRLCDLYQIGIVVHQLVFQGVDPPEPVKPAFNEVNQAIQEKERSINEAWADYNKSVPKARGEAEQIIHASEGYATERVNKAEGDAKRFDSQYEEYKKAPLVTRKRIYLETMGQLLPKLGRKIILDDKARGILPLLQLESEKRDVKP